MCSLHWGQVTSTISSPSSPSLKERMFSSPMPGLTAYMKRCTLASPCSHCRSMVTKRVVALGLGVMEDMTALTPDSLRTKIGALLEDRDMKDKCMRMSEDMKAAAKQDTTVQHLEADAASWRAVR